MTQEITMGSLFSGSGGFELAGSIFGIRPIWASEIEPFPILVTTKNFPEMKHLGDINKLNGADLEPVTIIAGGSPCQDMSIAGKREGLDGSRSNLFREQIRIIKEMRESDRAAGRTGTQIRPRYMVWENVPGAFSSNKGKDFQAVLQEIVSITDEESNVPLPPKGKWQTAGCIMGDHFTIAWRVLDAQYWGVPQRRKRIYLVADFGGNTAPKILFEREGLSGNFTESREAWQRTAGDIKTDTHKTGTDDVECYDISDRRRVADKSEVSHTLTIVEGRHPVVEQMQRDTLFVPNDTHLNDTDDRVAIVTGPNMAGKSTYMRQTAIIVLMAQIGSFVPARSATVGICDRVFTRIGASDDLAGGASTFMVEMSEVASILKNATADSLLILDEIGRGTSTYDGMAIARAVLEYCADARKLGAKTMFATHYHELSALEGTIPGVRNYNISAKRQNGKLLFLRKILPGAADESYGIEVAKLAGVPESVIRAADAHLRELNAQGAAVKVTVPAKPESDQVSLADVGADAVAERLRAVDPNTLSPLEALRLLFELKNDLG